MTWLAFVFSILYFIIPSKLFVKLLFKQRILKKSQEKTYMEVKDEFLTDYDRLNPVTSDYAMKVWFDSIAEKERQALEEADMKEQNPEAKKKIAALKKMQSRKSHVGTFQLELMTPSKTMEKIVIEDDIE